MHTPLSFRARLLAAIGMVIALVVIRAQAAPILPGGAILTPPEPDPTGGVKHFTIELTSINMMTRMGWRSSMINCALAVSTSRTAS